MYMPTRMEGCVPAGVHPSFVVEADTLPFLQVYTPSTLVPYWGGYPAYQKERAAKTRNLSYPMHACPYIFNPCSGRGVRPAGKECTWRRGVYFCWH